MGQGVLGTDTCRIWHGASPHADRQATAVLMGGLAMKTLKEAANKKCASNTDRRLALALALALASIQAQTGTKQCRQEEGCTIADTKHRLTWCLLHRDEST
eukprot:TRINITY_DN55115_c0_g1_i1.p2 TRINITY_DN55115_c0_g1~~TRINITY_DN55115_c0_g1_i1.p2  ORF type:complete len:101 (-),score=8.08 TRINITY_DN55115_c0_g1_i1:58-360(-)